MRTVGTNRNRKTIILRSDRWNFIVNTAHKQNDSPDNIIMLYIEFIINDLIQKPKFIENPIQYQKPAPKWEQPHISMTKEQYDRILDV